MLSYFFYRRFILGKVINSPTTLKQSAYMFAWLSLFFLSIGNAQTMSSSTKKKSANAYQAGEWFDFKISYGYFNASYARIELTKDTLANKEVFHAKGYGKTTGLARLFFKVDDYYESYFDMITNQPYFFVRNISEGNYTKNVTITFDHKSNEALVFDKKTGIEKKIATKMGIQDMISFFYYIRNKYTTKKFLSDKKFAVTLFFDEENYPFTLNYLGKETIKSKFGYVRCLKFQPVPQAGRVFKSKSKIYVWMSDDINMVPIKLKADLLIGSIEMNLNSFKRLKYPQEFKIQLKK